MEHSNAMAQAPKGRSEEAEDSRPALGASFHSPAVLIVDDDPDITTALLDLLVHEGYYVSSANSCQEALQSTDHVSYDAVLLDIGLPDGEGLWLLHHFQSGHPTMPVIMLSASTSLRQQRDSLSQGAFSYLSKPYDRDMLREVLRRAMVRI